VSGPTWEIIFGEAAIEVADIVDGRTWTLPIGHRLVHAELEGDPPRAESITNAIGLVVDHLDDVVRDTAQVIAAPMRISGHLVSVVADVEYGAGRPRGEYVLSRDAAEEVFRTLATESSFERRLNPGLPTDHVDTIVATCCMIVGVMRRFQLDTIVIAATP
jgi:exopolyphosphatase/guanosine-5'-triphosphate,3'-diphosphate pyrophosphatase